MSKLEKKETLKLGLVQMTSGQDPFFNLKSIKNLLNSVEKDLDFIIFPENSLFFSIDRSAGFYSFDKNSSELQELQDWVEKTGVSLFLGGIPFRSTLDQKKPYNSFVPLIPGRTISSAYNKKNLFKVQVEGAPPVDETLQFSSGKNPVVLDFKGWSFGLSICYDLRFSDHYLFYARESVDAIFVPSSFLVPTGQAHWHALLRARAIESQCYVVAPAQVGEHKNGAKSKWTYGHSLVIDPWGKVVCDLEKEKGLFPVVLQKEKIVSVRKQIPMIR